MKWISVKDRLPTGNYSDQVTEYSDPQLVINSANSPDVACYCRRNGTWYVGAPADGEWMDKITHWMPLPEPPNE